MMISSENELADAARCVQELIDLAKQSCPDLIPAPNEVLTDQKIIALLTGIARASGYFRLIQSPLFNAFLGETSWWLEKLCQPSYDLDTLVSDLISTADETGFDCLLGIEFWPPVYTYDDYVSGIENHEIPFAICINAKYDLDTSYANLQNLWECDFGNEGGDGVLAAALSPLFSSYKEEILQWKSSTDAKKGLRQYPLLAHLTWDYSLPGIHSDFLLGTMIKSGPIFQIRWKDIPQLQEELDILSIAEELADKIGILHQGRLLVEGTPRQLKEKLSASSLEEAFLRLTRNTP